jgi:hypothetical protein
MNPLVASLFAIDESYRLWIFLIGMAVVVAYGIVAFGLRHFVQWVKGVRSRDWSTVSAIVDIVTVQEQYYYDRYGSKNVTGYLATLTYMYHNPEMQLGDFSRVFAEEAEARQWVTSRKGQTVMVHVDPRDPTRSVLRKEDI